MRLLFVCALCLFANAFQTPPPRIHHRGAPTSRRTRLSVLNQKETLVSSQQDSNEINNNTSEKILLGNNLIQQSTSDLSSFGEPLNAGLAWRGVVGVLCALWASNFAAAKIILAEPGVDSSLYAGMTYYKWVFFTVNHYVQANMYPFWLSRQVTRFSVAALALAPFAIHTIRKSGIDVETIKGAIYCGTWVAFGT